MEGMEKQLTAVDWLVDKLKENGVDFWQEEIEMIEEAKEMEKEQIIEAHGDKKRTKSNSGSCVTYAYTFTGEMYYNETYKSE
jgi:hypothetical protein